VLELRSQIEVSERLLHNNKKLHKIKLESEDELVNENKYLKNLVADLKNNLMETEFNLSLSICKEKDTIKKYEELKSQIRKYKIVNVLQG